AAGAELKTAEGSPLQAAARVLQRCLRAPTRAGSVQPAVQPPRPAVQPPRPAVSPPRAAPPPRRRAQWVRAAPVGPAARRRASPPAVVAPRPTSRPPAAAPSRALQKTRV